MRLPLEEFMAGLRAGTILPSYYDENTKQIGHIFFGDYIPTLKCRPSYYTMTGTRKDGEGVWVDVYAIATHPSSHANEYRNVARRHKADTEVIIDQMIEEILAEEGTY